MESYLSNDEDARDTFIPSKNSPAENTAQVSKGSSIISLHLGQYPFRIIVNKVLFLSGFTAIGCNRTSNNKVLCCHFSSDGKLLASAGHEKKVNDS